MDNAFLSSNERSQSAFELPGTDLSSFDIESEKVRMLKQVQELREQQEAIANQQEEHLRILQRQSGRRAGSIPINDEIIIQQQQQQLQHLQAEEEMRHQIRSMARQQQEFQEQQTRLMELLIKNTTAANSTAVQQQPPPPPPPPTLPPPSQLPSAVFAPKQPSSPPPVNSIRAPGGSPPAWSDDIYIDSLIQSKHVGTAAAANRQTQPRFLSSAPVRATAGGSSTHYLKEAMAILNGGDYQPNDDFLTEPARDPTTSESLYAAYAPAPKQRHRSTSRSKRRHRLVVERERENRDKEIEKGKERYAYRLSEKEPITTSSLKISTDEIEPAHDQIACNPSIPIPWEADASDPPPSDDVHHHHHQVYLRSHNYAQLSPARAPSPLAPQQTYTMSQTFDVNPVPNVGYSLAPTATFPKSIDYYRKLEATRSDRRNSRQTRRRFQ